MAVYKNTQLRQAYVPNPVLIVLRNRGKVVTRRTTRALALTLLLGVIALWVFVPQLGLTPIVRAWLAALLGSVRAVFLTSAPFAPGALGAPAGTVLTATLAVMLPRVGMIAWRSYRFVRKRRKAALAKAAAAAL